MTTVGNLIRELRLHEPDAEVLFGPEHGVLTYYRVKERAADLVQIEFAEMITREEPDKVVLLAQHDPIDPPEVSLGEYLNRFDDYLDTIIANASPAEAVEIVRKAAHSMAMGYYHASPHMAAGAIWAQRS